MKIKRFPSPRSGCNGNPGTTTGEKDPFEEHAMKRTLKGPPVPDRLPVQVDDCPCTQVRCHRHGNCVECIRVHRTRQEHIPECLQDMFRERIQGLAGLVEFGIRDLRRTPAYWDERLGKVPHPSSPGKRSVPDKGRPRKRKPPRGQKQRDPSGGSPLTGE